MFYLMKPISVLSAEMVMQLSADLTNAKLILFYVRNVQIETLY